MVTARRLRVLIRGAGWLGVLGLVLGGASGCDRQPAPPPPAPAAPAAPVAALVPLTNMVPIKAGSFVQLKRTVTLSHDLWLGRYEVTQAEFLALLGRNPSHFQGRPEAPVEKVTHHEAVAYCAVLTRREREAGRLTAAYEYRLPTEAEWEYACRAGTTNLYSFGDSVADAAAHAWTSENSEETTHPVGLKQPNPWGLHDMHGNVWEWCQDWFADYPPGDVVDPLGPPQGKIRVFRGGGWDKEAPFARSANRFTMAPASGIYFVGFRVALAPVRRP